MRQLEQNAWIFTDPHYNHHRLVEMGDRPEGFEDLITTNWNLRVGQNDVVYCLGDVCFKGQAESHIKYIQPMPGYKVLILGNHDRQKEAWYLKYWNEVHTELMLQATVNGRHTRLLLTHVPQKDEGKWDLNLHGHFHNNFHRLQEPEMKAIYTKRHLLLSLEAVNYDFVRLQDLIEGRVEQPGLPVLGE